MQKSKLVRLVFCSLFGIGVVTAMSLYTYSVSALSNNFKRKISLRQPLIAFHLSLPDDHLYFVGFKGSKILVGTRKSPGILIMIDTVTKTAKKTMITTPPDLQVFEGAYLMSCDTSLYLMDGYKGLMLRGNIDQRKLFDSLGSPHFTAAAAMADGSFVFRYIKDNKNNIIRVHGYTAKECVAPLLTQQVDGLFCTDGILVSIPGQNKFMYVYYYRNEIVCADHQLKRLYTSRTIDTNTVSKITVTTIRSTGAVTLTTPPVFVNRSACANEHSLFVQSALRADNEPADVLDNVVVIDEYETSTGNYHSSFYLPKELSGKQLKEYKAYGEVLYALYGVVLYAFQLPK